MRRQLAYILARQQVNVETEDETLAEILNNTKLSENFKLFGKELNVTDPKSLEDIYKSHLESGREFGRLSLTQRRADPSLPLRRIGCSRQCRLGSSEPRWYLCQRLRQRRIRQRQAHGRGGGGTELDLQEQGAW